MQAIKFKNWTSEDFTWSFDKVPYTFKAGDSMYLEDFKAKHFAKHLADREMNRLKIPTDRKVDRDELERQCFPGDETVTPEVAINLNEEKKVKKTKKVEKEFPDLK